MLNVLLFTECDIQSKSLLYTREEYLIKCKGPLNGQVLVDWSPDNKQISLISSFVEIKLA